jgi:hypothetical protein
VACALAPRRGSSLRAREMPWACIRALSRCRLCRCRLCRCRLCRCRLCRCRLPGRHRDLPPGPCGLARTRPGSGHRALARPWAGGRADPGHGNRLAARLNSLAPAWATTLARSPVQARSPVPGWLPALARWPGKPACRPPAGQLPWYPGSRMRAQRHSMSRVRALFRRNRQDHQSRECRGRECRGRECRGRECRGRECRGPAVALQPAACRQAPTGAMAGPVSPQSSRTPTNRASGQTRPDAYSAAQVGH